MNIDLIIQETKLGEHKCPLHGDKHLMKFALQTVNKSKHFIETGTFHAETLKFIATSFPDKNCYSCEPNPNHLKWSMENVKDLKNVTLSNNVSPNFLYQLKSNEDCKKDDICTFLLDAHGYGYAWPLRLEVEFITSTYEKFYIFIDDFYNPFVEMNYDQYDGQVCSYSYIRNVIENKDNCDIYYPIYKEKTSCCHPLVGWCMITNQREVEFDEALIKKICCT